MHYATFNQPPRIKRVRAIILTEDNRLLFIKRVKPHKAPYWVAPGGGVEAHDTSLVGALERELFEELGATVTILSKSFVLTHDIAKKALEEHFYICRLVNYDLGLRNGPEFDDPSRGQFLPDEIELDAQKIKNLNIKTTQLADWLLDNLEQLRNYA